MTSLSGIGWLLAVSPLIAMLVLVGSGRFRTHTAAALVLALAVVIAATYFGAGPHVLAVSMGKGLWLGLWISFVVGPALLLYRICANAGFARVGRLLSARSDHRLEVLLVVAWLAPSLIQGIAGFGAPIALTAPLLASMGFGVVRAVVYPMIGYCWSVTFGSMASSYYMVTVTAHLDSAESHTFAITAAIMLGILALACGAAVCLLEGGPRGLVQTLPFLLVVGVPMGGILVLVASVVPAMATTTAAAGGIAVAGLWARTVRTRRNAPRAAEAPDPAAGPRPRWVIFAPYAALLATAFPVFLVPQSERWVTQHAVLALDFPRTETAGGWTNPAVDGYTPLAVLAHPGTYILAACVIGYLVYLLVGVPHEAPARRVVSQWLRSLPAALAPIFILTVLAMVLTDTGMTTTVALGLVAVFGSFYPLVAPLVGATGSFVTGSTTSSNALLSGLQSDAARLLGAEQTQILAAQTTGGNIGNAIAPVVIAVGASSVDATDRPRDILLRGLPAAGGLLVVASLLVGVAHFLL